MNIFTTIHSKYQGETIFCFVCVATVFGYILGVNKVIDAIITKHSDETRVKVVEMLNKYTQTNLSDLVEILASNHIIHSTFHNIDNHNNDENDVASNHINTNDGMNYDTNDEATETSENVKCEINPQSDQEKRENKGSQQQEYSVTSPSSTSSIISTTEEDYELVKKNENNHLKNKNTMKYFEWLNIF
jgi:hypothetical protein